jgi:tetratricopeptide (TPR) repeat protein
MIAILLSLALTAPAPEPSPKPPLPKLDAGLTEAFRMVKAGRFAEARQAVEGYVASGKAPHPGQAEFVIGLSYHRQMLYEGARTHFARALELEPDYVTAYFFYGFTLFNLGRLDEAKRALESYLARGPEDPEAVFGLGLVALEADRVDEAEENFRRAIGLAEARAGGGEPSPALREDLARYQARLGDVYLRREDLPSARAALQRSVDLWPDHFEPWHKLAGVLRRLGDTAAADRAQARYDEALRRRAAKGRVGP